MSMKSMRQSVPNLFKQGTKHISGVADAVVRNIEACKQLAKITRTSFGPNGMNKMVINHLDRLFVTSDAATIMNEMEVVHPAAKMMVMASNQQDHEIGDGSNFVIVLCGELLANAESLLRMGLHCADIVRGYTIAGEKALAILEELCTVSEMDLFSEERLRSSCFSAIQAKQLGNEDVLSSLVAEACCIAMPKNPKNFIVDNVRVAKVLGSSLHLSEVVHGVVVERPPSGTIHSVQDAKIALFVESIDASSTETKGTVLLKNSTELLNYNVGEEQLMERMIEAMAKAGAKCIISGGKISEMALHFIEKFGLMAVRINSKFELRRLAKSIGARLNLSINNVSPEDLGYCKRVFVREVGGARVIVFEQHDLDAKKSASASSLATIILRGSTMNALNDSQRAIDDGVNVVRAVCKDPRFVPGAGASEVELGLRLSQFADTCSGLEQHAIKKFAETLEVFPRTLADNCGLVSSDVISRLNAAHERGDASAGVEIEGGAGGSGTNTKVMDVLVTKSNALKLAYQTAATILNVDQIIMSKPAGGPKAPQQEGHWDDED